VIVGSWWVGMNGEDLVLPLHQSIQYYCVDGHYEGGNTVIKCDGKIKNILKIWLNVNFTSDMSTQQSINIQS
jgi:hypothetical protein